MNTTFLLTSLIIVATPGTGVLVTLAAGLSRGTRAAVVAAFGCTLGIVPHLLAAISGLAALLHSSPAAFDAMRYAGVVYLLYMAWSMLRARGALRLDAVTPASMPGIIRTAIVVNLLNPKLSLFFFAFLPQFVGNGESAPLPHMLELSGVFMLMTLLVFAVYGSLAAAVSRHVVSHPAAMSWIRRVFALALVGLAARLALTAR
jgi:threonine/homoserine/homoserine lactone efflux protein